MLSWFGGGDADRRKAGEIYGAVVAQARAVPFYSALGVPDTPVGRYETIVLHLFLVLERLRAGGADTEALQQMVIEAFVTDMDDQMREMGVGDLTVPKKVKRAAAVLYARIAAYRAGLAADDASALSDAVTAAFADCGATGIASLPIASYMRAAAASLTARTTAAIAAGEFDFPPPPQAR